MYSSLTVQPDTALASVRLSASCRRGFNSFLIKGSILGRAGLNRPSPGPPHLALVTRNYTYGSGRRASIGRRNAKAQQPNKVGPGRSSPQTIILGIGQAAIINAELASVRRHDPGFSDIDLLVYGLENARQVRGALSKGANPQIRRPDAERVATWCRSVVARFPLTREEARYFASRRWNYGFYGERYFSLHPTRTDTEITEQYGDHFYRSRGAARVRAIVAEAEGALFLPATYQVEGVQVLEGNPEAAEVREVVSYEGLYSDVADPGQRIEAQGKLESVDGEPRRLVIGTTQLEGAGYVKPIGIAPL